MPSSATASLAQLSVTEAGSRSLQRSTTSTNPSSWNAGTFDTTRFDKWRPFGAPRFGMAQRSTASESEASGVT